MPCILYSTCWFHDDHKITRNCCNSVPLLNSPLGYNTTLPSFVNFGWHLQTYLPCGLIGQSSFVQCIPNRVYIVLVVSKVWRSKLVLWYENVTYCNTFYSICLTFTFFSRSKWHLKFYIEVWDALAPKHQQSSNHIWGHLGDYLHVLGATKKCHYDLWPLTYRPKINYTTYEL